MKYFLIVFILLSCCCSPSRQKSGSGFITESSASGISYDNSYIKQWWPGDWYKECNIVTIEVEYKGHGTSAIATNVIIHVVDDDGKTGEINLKVGSTDSLK